MFRKKIPISLGVTESAAPKKIENHGTLPHCAVYIGHGVGGAIIRLNIYPSGSLIC